MSNNNHLEVTAKYLHDNRTPKGSWTRSQFEVLGIDWPPAKGWKEKVIGLTISPEQQSIFEKRLNASQAMGKKEKSMKISKAIKMLKLSGYKIIKNGIEV